MLLGVDEAIILGELASEYSFWLKNGGVDDEGCFYSTVDNVYKNTGIKEKRQRTALNNLKQSKVIDIKLKGLPARRFIKINEEVLETILKNEDDEQNKLGQNGGASSVKTAELDKANIPINNNNQNNNKKESKEKTNINISSKESVKKFIPPTVEEVAKYCEEKGYNLNANSFVDYYTANGWKVGKNPMKDWKAGVRYWASRNDNGKKEDDEKEARQIGALL